MKRLHLIMVATLVLILSCKKEITSPDPAPIPPSPEPILLKDIVMPNLPSPYYHFEYDNSGKAVFASFASDFTRYDILYSNGRISEMKNNILVNKDRLLYSYDDAGRVTEIRYTDSTGLVYTKLLFTYQGQQLAEEDRIRKSGTDFITDRTLNFSYGPDGNLSFLIHHYLPFNGQGEVIYTDYFTLYDDKPNADGFSLLHDEFFDHLVLLPGVTLQKNNPGKETRTGDAVNYEVTYSYTYNEKNLPLERKGDFVFTNGPDAGKHYPTNTFFSYY